MGSVITLFCSLVLNPLSRPRRILASAVPYILLSLVCYTAAQAAEYGTRDDAVAMVRRVQDGFKKDGPEATFKAVNAKRFVDRDMFPWVFRLSDGTNVANARLPALRGQNLIDLRDEDGKFVVRDWIRIANTPPYHGWSDYRWPDPGTGMVEQKSGWIERMGDYVVGVGVHRSEDPNENSVGIVSGSIGSDDTYLEIAVDLADVLNDGDKLRVVPVAGVGGSRNIRDVMALKGVDVGLTQTPILNSFRHSIELMGQTNKIAYITKLFNEEVHLVAGPGITSIEQLRGRKVNLDAAGSGTSYAMRGIFNTFGIEVEEVALPQRQALEKIKSGEIAATAMVSGKPVRVMSELSADDGLHFVPVPYPAQLLNDYLPATLDHDDYPDLIAEGGSVETVAAGAVLIAPDWPKTDEHYRRIQRFVDALFSRIDDLNKWPRHAKWHEVNIAATMPGWPRFGAAQEWLDGMHPGPQHATAEALTRVAFALQAATPADTGTAPAEEQATDAAKHNPDLDLVDPSSAVEKHNDVPSPRLFRHWLAMRHPSSHRADTRTAAAETPPSVNRPAAKGGVVTESAQPVPGAGCKRSKAAAADGEGSIRCEHKSRHVADGRPKRTDPPSGDAPVEIHPESPRPAGVFCLAANSSECPLLGDEQHR